MEKNPVVGSSILFGAISDLDLGDENVFAEKKVEDANKN